MLPVIPTEEKTGRNCLFVKIDNGKYIFTAGGQHCVKKVVLFAQTTVDEAAGCRKKEKKLPNNFMIPRGSLKAFGEMLKDHKSICKKLGKDDLTHLYIEIDDEEMESIGEYVHFKQPKFQYKDLQHFFQQKTKTVTGSVIMSGEIESAMTGFSKTKQVESFYYTMDNADQSVNLIHFKQESTEYEAVFICPSKEVEKKKEDNEQF